MVGKAAVGSVAGVVVGQMEKKGNIIMAAKFIDPQRTVIAELADYEEDDSALIVDFKDFYHFSHHRRQIEYWSKELAETYSTTKVIKVKGKPLFTLNPF